MTIWVLQHFAVWYFVDFWRLHFKWDFIMYFTISWAILNFTIIDIGSFFTNRLNCLTACMCTHSLGITRCQKGQQSPRSLLQANGLWHSCLLQSLLNHPAVFLARLVAGNGGSGWLEQGESAVIGSRLLRKRIAALMHLLDVRLLWLTDILVCPPALKACTVLHLQRYSWLLDHDFNAWPCGVHRKQVTCYTHTHQGPWEVGVGIARDLLNRHNDDM